MGMPSALASGLRATTHPSLLDSTTTGRLCKVGSNTLSIDTNALFTSTRAMYSSPFLVDASALVGAGLRRLAGGSIRYADGGIWSQPPKSPGQITPRLLHQGSRHSRPARRHLWE